MSRLESQHALCFVHAEFDLVSLCHAPGESRFDLNSRKVPLKNRGKLTSGRRPRAATVKNLPDGLGRIGSRDVHARDVAQIDVMTHLVQRKMRYLHALAGSKLFGKFAPAASAAATPRADYGGQAQNDNGHLILVI